MKETRPVDTYKDKIFSNIFFFFLLFPTCMFFIMDQTMIHKTNDTNQLRIILMVEKGEILAVNNAKITLTITLCDKHFFQKYYFLVLKVFFLKIS